MHQIEAADPNRRLVGLEHMLKKADRLKEKIADALRARPGLTAAQALSIVPDPCDSPSRTARIVTLMVCSPTSSDLKEIGLEELKLKNLWSDEQYKGINSQWRRQRLACVSKCSSTRQRAWRPRNSPTRHTNASAAQYHATERNELEDFQRRVNALLDTPPGTTEIRTSRRNDMAQTITYYAIIDEFSSRDRPGGVLRRVVDDNGQVDEAFSPHLTWEFSSLLYAAERGDTMFDFVPITEAEADQIVTRIRESAESAE